MKAIMARAWSNLQGFAIEDVPAPLPNTAELLVAIDTAAVNCGQPRIATGR